MAGDQASRLPYITCVVKKFSLISMGEAAASGQQHCLRRGHIPVFGCTAPGQGDIEICFAPQDRGHFATDAAYGS